MPRHKHRGGNRQPNRSAKPTPPRINCASDAADDRFLSEHGVCEKYRGMLGWNNDCQRKSECLFAICRERGLA